MNTVGHICLHVSHQMNDQRAHAQYTRWTRSMLVEYLNQGLKEIATYKPDAFARTLDLTLVAGRAQTLPEGVSLRGFGAGTDGRLAHESDDSLLKSFTGFAPCPPRPKMKNGRLDYSIKSFSVDNADPNIFYVSPPVPLGANLTVKANVDGSSEEYTLADWDETVAISDKYYNNLLTYMEAMAYGVDTESQVSLNEKARLLGLFYQTMGVKYKVEAARNSGYENGRVGTGDPRSARV